MVADSEEGAKNDIVGSVGLDYIYMSKIYFKFDRLDVLNMFTEITVYL